MLHRQVLVRAAAVAALACAGIVRADSATPTPVEGLSLRPMLLDATTAPAAPAAPEATPAAPPTLLMGLLGPAGTKLSDMGIHVGGYIEGAYTYSASAPPGNVIGGRTFDTKHERIVLDQLDFAISKTVDYAAAAKNHTFDIGATFEVIYGFDSGLIHSNGLYDNPSTLRKSSAGAYYSSRTQPENQFDINQAYVDIALPIGEGLRIRVGKEVTPLGYEVINPTGNAFYSHSYLFGYAIPFTNTGIFGEYKFGDEWVFDAGVSRGFNQSLRDNNGSPDILSSVTYTPQKTDFLKKMKFIVNTEVGPNASNDNHDWWTVIDAQAIYTDGPTTLAVNADYGDAPHALATSSAQWFGVAGYCSYKVNSLVTLNGRLEWYDDNNGFTLGAPGNLNVYEATFGVSITPFADNNIGKNLVIRPEVRMDYASKAFFDAGTDRYQFTAALDAYFTY